VHLQIRAHFIRQKKKPVPLHDFGEEPAFYCEQLLLAAGDVGLAASRAIFAAVGSLSHGAKRQNAQQTQHLNNFTHSCHLFKNHERESRL
jgi:hypothetical protein